MDEMFADWYARADREPSEERLQKRAAGVDGFLSEADRQGLLSLVRFVKGARSEESDVGALQDALKGEDATYLMRDNLQEVRTLACVALLLAIKREVPLAVGAALAVDAASALGSEELGPLSSDLIGVAQAFIMAEGRRIREEPALGEKAASKLPALNVSDPSLPHPETGNVSQVQENVVHLAERVKELGAVVKGLAGPLRTLKAAQENLVASCAFNSVLAEECSMLWWLIGAHSRVDEKPLSALSKEGVCLVIGRDLADLTRLSPGPLSVRAIIYKALESVGADPNEEVELHRVVDGLDREWCRSWIGEGSLSWLRGVGRCLPSVACLVELGPGSNWRELAERREGVVPDQKLTRLQWARLAYGESLLAQWYEDAGE